MESYKQKPESADNWSFIACIFNQISEHIPFNTNDLADKGFTVEKIYKMNQDPSLVEKYGPEKCKLFDDFFLNAFRNYKNIESCEKLVIELENSLKKEKEVSI